VTTADATVDLRPLATDVVRARPAGAIHDVVAIAGRALRLVPRDVEAIIPPVFIAVFFFVVNIATLENLTQQTIRGFDYTAFEMATAVLLGVTGVSRAQALVVDVQDGYFDRLLLTPVQRSAILIGHMVADVAVSISLCIPIVALAFALGIDFHAGALGVVVFVVLAALWSLSFAGFGYAIALKTGNPAAVNSSFLLFFPFLFLTSSYVPRSQLSGWLDSVATVNPVTYLLEGLRSLALAGWHWGDLGQAFAALLAVFTVSFALAFAALRSRVHQR
jgi:ABC-2 type transport system permease protein